MLQKQANRITELITDEFKELWASKETIQILSSVSERVLQLLVHIGYICVFDLDSC